MLSISLALSFTAANTLKKNLTSKVDTSVQKKGYPS